VRGQGRVFRPKVDGVIGGGISRNYGARSLPNVLSSLHIG